MSKTVLLTCMALALLGPVVAQAQTPASQSFTLAASLIRSYQNVQRNVLEAAEKMPEADYRRRSRWG